MLEIDAVVEIQPGLAGNLSVAAEADRPISNIGEEASRRGKLQLYGEGPRAISQRIQITRHEWHSYACMDDTRVGDRLVIVDISYDSTSSSGRITPNASCTSVQLRW